MADRKKPETAEEYRALLLNFVASLMLCDHMGDVSNDMLIVLEDLGVKVEDMDEGGREWGSLPRQLHQMGARTLYGSEIWDPADDEEIGE